MAEITRLRPRGLDHDSNSFCPHDRCHKGAPEPADATTNEWSCWWMNQHLPDPDDKVPA